jgi:hypothetical protein
MHFVEWADLWSGGYMFHLRFSPFLSETGLTLCGDRFEVYGHCLPDRGRLLRRLSKFQKKQSAESEMFVTRLREAVDARQHVVGRSLILVLREPVGPLIDDGELAVSLGELPGWLTRIR